MFNRVIVPVDGSDAAWRGVIVGSRLAMQCHAELEVLYADDDPAMSSSVERAIRQRLVDESVDTGACSVITSPRLHGTAAAIAHRLEQAQRGVVVMSSHGHGRSSAILGNVADDVVRTASGPIVVVGPHANIDRPNFRGSVLVAVDGSTLSEAAVGIAGAWSIGLGAVPWIATVIATGAIDRDDTIESGYTHQLATDLERRTRQRVEFEVLHGGNPGLALSEFAAEIDASLIFASTHGRSGAARIAFGSVAAGIVRHAPCPVVLFRPATVPRPFGAASGPRSEHALSVARLAPRSNQPASSHVRRHT